MRSEYLGEVNNIITGSQILKFVNSGGRPDYPISLIDGKDGDITWLKYNHDGKTILLSSSVILGGSAWKDYNACGVMSGREIKIDNHIYICRTILSEEWDDLIVKLVPDENISHWNERYTITNTIRSSDNYVIYRGASKVDGINYYEKGTYGPGLGWRALLEVKNSPPQISISNIDLGHITEIINTNYSVTELDGENFTLIEKLDDDVVCNFTNQSSDTSYTFWPSSNWGNVSYGKHTIEIIATDTNGLSSKVTVTFNKIKEPIKPIPITATLKQAIESSKEIKREIDYQCLKLEKTLNEKGLKVLQTDKMSSLIDKVGDLVNIPGIPTWADVGDYWFRGVDSDIDRNRGCCVAVNDELYIMGGYNGNKLTNNTSYNLQNNVFTEKEPMPTGNEDMAISVVGTDIYIFGGGYDKTGCYKYDTISDSWSTISNFPVQRSNASATSVGTNIYIFGGYQGTADPVNTNYMYDTLSNTYTLKEKMKYALKDVMCESYNNDIYVFGGSERYSYSGKNTKYDTISDTWSNCAWIGTYISGSASCIIGDYIYLAGGLTSNGKSKITRRYDILNDVWSICTDIPTPIDNPCGKNIGEVFVLTNGIGDNPSYNRSTYCYVPKVKK